MTNSKTAQPVRVFASALNNVKYKYGRPLPATRENLRLVGEGKL